MIRLLFRILLTLRPISAAARKVIVEGMTHPLKKSTQKTLQEQMTTVYSDSALSLDPDFAKSVTAFVAGV